MDRERRRGQGVGAACRQLDRLVVELDDVVRLAVDQAGDAGTCAGVVDNFLSARQAVGEREDDLAIRDGTRQRIEQQASPEVEGGEAAARCGADFHRA